MNDMDLSTLDSAMEEVPSMSAHDDESGIIDLRQMGRYVHESQQNPSPPETISRRPSQVSDSSYSMISGGRVGDMAAIEDLTPHDVTYPSPGSEWSMVEQNPQSSTFSPMESPRPHSMRNQPRSRTSPAPHNARTSPYTIDSNNRRQRWSTGNSGIAPAVGAPNTQRAQYSFNRHSSFYGSSPLNPHNALASVSNDHGVTTFAAPGQTLAYSQRMFPGHPGAIYHPFPDAPRQLPSQSLFPMLPSNVDRLQGFGNQFADLSEPPDLYVSLQEEPSEPPEEDMHPEDEKMTPHEQEPRFPGDLYTPKWVRGHGNKREGWCGYCKPGRWLVLKNSAYWYDKSFTHGACSATGHPFQPPSLKRRTEGNAEVWEGLCGSCQEWIRLTSTKKKGTTWFRHAYKVGYCRLYGYELTVIQCHPHPKVKDGPKRRRETGVNSRPASSLITTVPEGDVTPSSDDMTPDKLKRDADGDEDMAQDEATPMNHSIHSEIKQEAVTTLPKALVSNPLEQCVKQTAEPMILESIESAPLTATRTSGDFTAAEIKPSTTNSELAEIEEEFKMAQLAQQQFNSRTGTEHSKPTTADLQLQSHQIEDRKSMPSPAETPVTTPQLSTTSLSTPQRDTPVHQSTAVLGLGVRGLMTFDMADQSSQGLPLHYNPFSDIFSDQNMVSESQNSSGHSGVTSNPILSQSSTGAFTTTTEQTPTTTASDPNQRTDTYSQFFSDTSHTSHPMSGLGDGISSMTWALDNDPKSFTENELHNGFANMGTFGHLESYPNMF